MCKETTSDFEKLMQLLIITILLCYSATLWHFFVFEYVGPHQIYHRKICQKISKKKEDNAQAIAGARGQKYVF